MSAPDRELIKDVRSALRQLADAEKAPQMQAYMKSEMPFLGVQTPHHRRACREIFQRRPIASAEVWRLTALALWREAEFREELYCCLNLLNERAYMRFRTMEALPMYREMIVTGAWWDLVDHIAPFGVCTLLERTPGTMGRVLRQWASGRDIWKRRASIICQLRRKADTDTTLLYDCIEPSLGESEFFLRKAIGWALREHAKTDPDEVLRYVRSRRERLSQLSKREALRRVLPADELAEFLGNQGGDLSTSLETTPGASALP